MPSVVRTELFPTQNATGTLELTLHGEEKGEQHVNSTMQKALGSRESEMKGREKSKLPRKFKRIKRDVLKGEVAKGAVEKVQKKWGGDDLMEIEQAEEKEMKKAKCDKVAGVEEKSTTNEAGLSEQPCRSQ